MMGRKTVDVLCVQESRWKEHKEMGNAYKLYYMGEDGRQNGVGIVVSPEMGCYRRTGRQTVMSMKLDLNKMVVNVICAYAS